MSEYTIRNRRGREYIEWPTGHVYFAGFPGRPDLVKIGWSQNPWHRAKSLGPYVVVLGTIEIERGSPSWGYGVDSLEFRLHRRLARHRVDPRTMEFTDRGEWYALTSDQAKAFALQLVAQDTATGASSGPTLSSASNTGSAQP